MTKNTLQWLSFSEDIRFELLQAEQEGKEVKAYYEDFQEIERESDWQKKEDLAGILMDKIRDAPVKKDFTYAEPVSLEDILNEREGSEEFDQSVPYTKNEKLLEKVYGAWLARCAGCLLGQPIENWYSDRITGLLKETNNFPVSGYIRSDIEEKLRIKYNIVDEGRVYGGNRINWINNVECAPEDDDTNYTVLSLKLLKRFGKGFTREDVAEAWLLELQPLRMCTAERVVCRNLLNLVPVGKTSVTRNPYREWLGAQIRVDLYGYINPGNPRLAAEMAYRDAALSHVKSAVYSAMFISAMIAYAAVCEDELKIVRAGLSQIPSGSRLYAKVSEIIQLKRNGTGIEEILKMISNQYDEKNQHDWCHAIPNTLIIVAAFLYCDKDFDKLFHYCICIGFDTDCNAANAGSILGMILGEPMLDSKWKRPLNDTLKTAIEGYHNVRIKALAEETFQLI